MEIAKLFNVNCSTIICIILIYENRGNVQGAAKKSSPPKVFCRFLGNCLEFCLQIYILIYYFLSAK